MATLDNANSANKTPPIIGSWMPHPTIVHPPLTSQTIVSGVPDQPEHAPKCDIAARQSRKESHGLKISRSRPERQMEDYGRDQVAPVAARFAENTTARPLGQPSRERAEPNSPIFATVVVEVCSKLVGDVPNW